MQYHFMNGFNQYLIDTKQSIDDFALKIQKPRETVRRWALGIAKPQGQNMSLVCQATNNTITPNDFYNLPEAPTS